MHDHNKEPIHIESCRISFLNQERLLHVDTVKCTGGPVQTYLVSFVTSLIPGMNNTFSLKKYVTILVHSYLRLYIFIL